MSRKTNSPSKPWKIQGFHWFLHTSSDLCRVCKSIVTEVAAKHSSRPTAREIDVTLRYERRCRQTLICKLSFPFYDTHNPLIVTFDHDFVANFSLNRRILRMPINHRNKSAQMSWTIHCHCVQAYHLSHLLRSAYGHSRNTHWWSLIRSFSL